MLDEFGKLVPRDTFFTTVFNVGTPHLHTLVPLTSVNEPSRISYYRKATVIGFAAEVARISV